MASKVKSIKKNSKAAESLKQDKEETLEVKKLLKDERTHKITGSVLILVALLLLQFHRLVLKSEYSLCFYFQSKSYLL